MVVFALQLGDTAFQLLPHFIGGPDIEVMRDIWELSDKQVPPEELLRRKQEHYERLLKTMDIAPRPGFVEFLREVWHLGLEVSIGSLTPSSQARGLLARSGVGRLIGEKNIVLAEDVKNHKPAPDVFLRTAALMGIQAQYQIVFEDSPRGVQARKRTPAASSSRRGAAMAAMRSTTGPRSGPSQRTLRWTTPSSGAIRVSCSPRTVMMTSLMPATLGARAGCAMGGFGRARCALWLCSVVARVRAWIVASSCHRTLDLSLGCSIL